MKAHVENFGFGKILNTSLPYDPFKPPHDRLPGAQPLGDRPWLMQNDAFGAQMALKDWLFDHHPDRILQLLPPADEAVAELYDLIMAEIALTKTYKIEDDAITRPDGVNISRQLAPMVQIGRLIQEDMVILADDSELTLLGGVLAFPAGWILSEKIGRSLMSIHAPVAIYSEEMNFRVSRMIKFLREGAPVWRVNAHSYEEYELHRYLGENERDRSPVPGPYLRSERQVLRRLPQTGCTAFSILTHIVDRRSANPF